MDKGTTTKTPNQSGATIWDALAVLALPLILAFQGYVVMLLWAWHVVPVFSAPALGFGHAVGLQALLGLLKTRPPASEKSLSHTTVTAIVIYLASLLVGWCAR
jgi:hypothetical protein